MASTLESLARDWKSTSDHEDMRLSFISWKVRHKTPASYKAELESLNRDDAKILYEGFVTLSEINTHLFSQVMSISLGSRL